MMQAWIAFALVSGAVSANIPEVPTWRMDYSEARLRAAEAGKPLVVVFGDGQNGWAKLTGDAGMDGRVGRLLAQNFVCVYADKDTSAGKRLADALEVTGRTGVVISDRTAGLQAFHHDGEMSRPELVSALEKYSSPDHVVVTTETNAAAVPVAYQAPVAPIVGGWTGGNIQNPLITVPSFGASPPGNCRR